LRNETFQVSFLEDSFARWRKWGAKRDQKFMVWKLEDVKYGRRQLLVVNIWVKQNNNWMKC